MPSDEQQSAKASAEPKGEEPQAKRETNGEKAERKAREKAEREAARASAEPKGEEPQAKRRQRRVWAHGSLYIDGNTYAAGEVVDLPEHVAATIPCLELVEVPEE